MSATSFTVWKRIWVLLQDEDYVPLLKPVEVVTHANPNLGNSRAPWEGAMELLNDCWEDYLIDVGGCSI